MRKYLYILLAIGLCWGGAVLSDDDNPFEDPIEDDDPFAETLEEDDDPFAEEEEPGVKADEDEDPFADDDDPFSSEDEEDPFAGSTKDEFNGRYVGKLMELRIWPKSGETYEGELRFKDDFYPVKGELRKGVLHCQAGEEFEFTLGSEEEKYLLRSGKFKEEMKKQEFPALEKEYEGEKGVKLHIKEKKKTRYTGVIEFKEKELEFEGDERAGALEGNMQYENDPQPFRLYPEDGKLIFQTGKFKDELMTEYERKIAPHLKAAREARAKKAWKELTDELEEIAKVDEKNSELQKLKAEVAHQKEEELKEAKEAKEQEEWKVVKKKVEVVLALEKDNEEAKRLKEQAEEELKKPHTGDNTTIQLGNGVELEMIWIEPGTFIMGSPANELGRLSNELQHQVTLTKGYWLGKYEVTQAQYEAIMGKNPSSKIMGLGIGTNYPVNCVSWKDATNFCAKLTEMEREAGQLPKGYVYTLPTEAQWEYACRAGTTTALNSGANLTSENDCPYMDEVGWSWYNSGNRTHPTWYNPGRTTHFVGQKRPNAWGLYDMHGNMSELCLDWFDKNYYEESPATDPQGPDKGSYRVIRGGYWGSHAGGCRSAYRSYSAPGSRGSYCGFRVALAPVQ